MARRGSSAFAHAWHVGWELSYRHVGWELSYRHVGWELSYMWDGSKVTEVCGDEIDWYAEALCVDDKVLHMLRLHGRWTANAERVVNILEGA